MSKPKSAGRTRLIISVDAERCIGCGDCVKACLTGALQIVDGKSQLVSERLCDGFGSCIAACRNDAIRLEYREVEDFDWSLVDQISFDALMAKLRLTSGKKGAAQRLNASITYRAVTHLS